jgi:hypothetical protein
MNVDLVDFSEPDRTGWLEFRRSLRNLTRQSAFSSSRTIKVGLIVQTWCSHGAITEARFRGIRFLRHQQDSPAVRWISASIHFSLVVSAAVIAPLKQRQASSN